MRFVGVLLAVAMAACPAYAQTAPAKPKPAKPAAKSKPAPAAAARAGYASLSDAERMKIQSDLIWTGDYNGTISAEMGDRAIAAVKAFQKRNGGRETGVLGAEERIKLAQSAKSKQEGAGWRLVDDSATGAWLGLPGRLVPQTSARPAGSHWQSARGEAQVDSFRVVGTGTTLASVFERQKKEPAERKVEYSVMRGDFFVISGLQGLKKFYVRAQIKDAELRGLTILYDQALEGIWDPITVAMSNAFFAFPTGQFVGVLPPGPPPRPKVEYGTGIVVSAAGHILADRQLTEGCQSITVPPLGQAERMADDKTADIALLRVYGASTLSPATLGGEPSPSVTLIGIADPQAQNGGAAITTVSARVAASDAVLRPIEPVPAPGFSGAAAIDTNARILGMVGLKAPETAGSGAAARAALAGADAIRAFLSANSVAPHAGPASVEQTKAAVVRVICVRR